MRDLLFYIIQVNFLLSLLFLGYYVMLRKLTFYNLNRIYFLAGAGYALIYPFINFKALFAKRSFHVVSEVTSVLVWPVKTESVGGVSLTAILLGIICVGALFFSIILIGRLRAIYRIHRASKQCLWKAYPYREVPYRIHPFTFLKYIYLHQKQHSSAKLDTIFKHENIHAKAYHTFDILIYEIFWVMNWFNPLVWLMRKSVRQNLEYLTDQRLLNEGVNCQEYQYALVGLAQNHTPELPGNTFSFKPLKNRIMMMNKQPSSKLHLGKYLFLLPTFVFVGVGFTAALAQDKIEDLTQKAQEKTWTVEPSQAPQPLLVVNGKTYESENVNSIDPNSIERMNVLKDEAAIEKYGEKGRFGVIEIELKDGEKMPAVASKTTNNDGKTPLYVINDKKVSPEEAENLKPEDIESIEVFKDKTVLGAYGEEAKNGLIKITLKKKGETETQPELRKVKGSLYIIEGKKAAAKDVENLKPESIKSIEVLKDNDALKAYGKEAKNGAVIISLKKE